MKKIFNLFICFILLFGIFGCSASDTTTETNKEFEEFCDKVLVAYIKSSPFNANYLVSDYTDYGIRLEDFKDSEFKTKSYLKELKKFDKDDLSDDQDDLYDILLFDLTSQVEQEKYEDKFTAFSPMKGSHYGFANNMMQFSLDSEQDIELYFHVLENISSDFDELLATEAKISNNGNGLSNDGIDSVVEFCKQYTVDAQTHPFNYSFTDNIANLDIDETKKAQYIAKNKEYISLYVIPLYNKLATEISNGRDKRVNQDKGVGTLKDGKEYYQTIIRSNTGTTYSAKKWLKISEDTLESKTTELYSLLFSLGENTYQEYLKGDFVTAKTPQEYMDALESNYKKLFPTLDNINLDLDKIDANLEVENVAAYYLIPRIDSYNDNTIRYSKNISSNKDLVTTLAHEGYPGHLLQIVTAHSLDIHDLRKAYTNLYYVEGWSNYIEQYVFDIFELDNPDIKKLANFDAELNDYLLLSVMIKYDTGVSNEELVKYSQGLGYDLKLEDIQGITSMLKDDPGVLLPYTAAPHLMQSLATHAKDELGKDYNAKEFHKVILNNPYLNYEKLLVKVNNYIDSID